MSCNISTQYPLGGNATTQLCGVNEPLLTYGFLTNQVERCCNQSQLNIAPQLVQTLNNCTKYCEYGGSPVQWDFCIKSGLTDSLAEVAFPYCDGQGPSVTASVSASASASTTTTSSANGGQTPNLGRIGWLGVISFLLFGRVLTGFLAL